MATRSLGAKAAATRETIAELCENPPSAPELVEEVADRVKRVVPFDGGAWMVTDPESGLPTNVTKEGGTPELHAAFTRAELLDGPDDVNSFLAMIQSGQTAAGLALTTQGDLTASQRYRDIHLPFGLHRHYPGRRHRADAEQFYSARDLDLPDRSVDRPRGQ